MKSTTRMLGALLCALLLGSWVGGCSAPKTSSGASPAASTCTSNLQCQNGQACSGGVCQPALGAAGNGGASNGGAAGASTGGALASSGAGSGVGGATTGGGGSDASGGSAPMACLNDPNLALDGGWVGCDPASADDNPMGLQGSIYMYHDGSTCTSPVEACGVAGCCIKGATAVDPTFAKWGCGLGFELNSSGGATPLKMAYAGPAKCFDIKLAGSSGGNPVRIAYTQSDMMDGKVAPFLELKPFADGFNGTVCFDDVTCPTEWMPPPNCALARTICRFKS